MFLLLLLLACDKNACPEGEIRDRDGGCLPYEPGDPVQGDQPTFEAGLSWQWQITGKVDTRHDVEVYDVDLSELTPTVHDQLRADGRRIVCYFSAGSYEPWQADADQFPEESIGRKLDGWPDERWLDHTDPRVREVMLSRLDMAVEKGCDGVEPDNVTAHDANSGFGINASEQLDYNRFLADAAHERDLAMALKNDVEQVPELVDWFDMTVNEECADYDECDTLKPFLDADKAVFNAEYVDDWADAQDKAKEVCGTLKGMATIVKTWDLGSELLACEI